MGRYGLVLLFASTPFWLPACSSSESVPMPSSATEQGDPRLEHIGTSESGLHKGQAGAANGQVDYCDDPTQKCVSGEGDCDLDSQCTGAGIVCGTKNGPRFGMETQIDVCVPSTCKNGVQDGAETGIDCGGGGCGACVTCPLSALGTKDHCSYLCPCPAYEGDCDADYECTNGNVCKVGVGPLYGEVAGNDVCVPTHCNNGVQDSGETGVDCGAACNNSCSGVCPPAGQSNGMANFCSPTCPCSAKQGDCDADRECATGLKCGIGKGPQFNFGAIDVCVATHCANGVKDGDETGVDCGGADCGLCSSCSGTNGTVGFCDSCYCVGGQGSCTSDAECKTGLGLKCGNANGPQFSFASNINVCVPSSCTNGIKDGAETGIDCGTAACGGCLGGCGALNTANHCQSTCKCPAGEGDCDTNADCQFGLVCANGNGAKFGQPAYDYCVPPHCTDGRQNSDETGVDCGGSCGSVGCVSAPNTSCASGANSNCGSTGDESCCSWGSVTGATYNRLNNGSYPATVSTLKLDNFEVSVGRFRSFLAAFDTWRNCSALGDGGVSCAHPAVGEGAHPLITNSGWQQTNPATWPLDTSAATISAHLTDGALCPSPPGSTMTWTASAGANEAKPVNCVSWYEAYAFCLWDGGRLATEAEWNLAAAGGTEQRTYPWGNTAPDNTLATFACQQDGNNTSCTVNDMVNVGGLPAGKSKYGQSDMAGNVWDYTFDFYAATPPATCTNCANLTFNTWRVIRGGSFASAAPGTNLANTQRSFFAPANRAGNVGFRCAR